MSSFLDQKLSNAIYGKYDNYFVIGWYSTEEEVKFRIWNLQKSKCYSGVVGDCTPLPIKKFLEVFTKGYSNYQNIPQQNNCVQSNCYTKIEEWSMAEEPDILKVTVRIESEYIPYVNEFCCYPVYQNEGPCTQDFSVIQDKMNYTTELLFIQLYLSEKENQKLRERVHTLENTVENLQDDVARINLRVTAIEQSRIGSTTENGGTDGNEDVNRSNRVNYEVPNPSTPATARSRVDRQDETNRDGPHRSSGHGSRYDFGLESHLMGLLGIPVLPVIPIIPVFPVLPVDPIIPMV